jgi:hypothetical protein
MTEVKLSERSWTAIVILYLCLIYPPFILSNAASEKSFIKGDCFYYRAVIISLLHDGDLLLANNVQDRNPLDGQLALGKGGLVPKHPIIMPLISIPFYLLLRDHGLLVFNILDCIILIVLIFKLNCLFFSRLIALITTILYATGTLFLDYTYNYSPDVFSTVLVLSGLYLVLKEKFFTGAFLLGWSLFAKIPNAPLAAVILLYAILVILRRVPANGGSKEYLNFSKVGSAVTTIVIFIMALMPLAYTNYLLFGSPVVTGYQRTAIAGDAPGEVLSVDHSDRFSQPLIKGAYQLLFHHYYGVVPTNPIIILAFLGVISMRKTEDRPKLFLILTLCFIQFIFFSKYNESQSSHFSNRFLMTFVALSSVFTSNFLSYFSAKYLPGRFNL